MSQAILDAERSAQAPATISSMTRTRVLRLVLMLGGTAAILAAALTFWLHGGRYLSVDNAYVRATKLSVSTDVSGIVADIAVKDGQRVARGDVLFRLDSAPFENALAVTKANLAQAVLGVEAMKRDYHRMLHDIDAKQAQVEADQANFERFSAMVKSGGVTRAEYDDTRYRLAANRAAVKSLAEQAQVQLARLGGNAGIAAAETPVVREKQALLNEAQRQFNHTTIRAPFAGIATQVDTLQPGMFLAASVAAFGLISTERVWVEANPKETDLTYVKPGAPVEVTIDAYPGRSWHASVATISPNSGAEFAILPAQNASGNWVKVVQRIPLRIEVLRTEADPELRSGMSAVVTIDTGHIRQLSELWQ